jgi:membrane protein
LSSFAAIRTFPTVLYRARRALLQTRKAIAGWLRAIWERDRTQLPRGAAFGNRVLRIVVASIRGLGVHLVGLHAAALTYYTVFSIVPFLVVVLSIVKATGRIPSLTPDLPNIHKLSSGNALLTSALRKLFENVNQTAAVTGGIVSLGVLVYAVVRLFAYSERALDTIAAAARRPLKLSRLLGYLALILLLPLLATVGGLVAALASSTVGSRISALLGHLHHLKLVMIAGVGLLTLALAIAIFYSAAARARIPFSSAAVGAGVAAVLLSVVLWAFGAFQIGMSHGNAVQFGATAGPVLLLWIHSSWYVLLFGAEIAVAHGLDRVLVHGAWTFHPDVAGRQQTGIAIMVEAARDRPHFPPVEALARDLRLPPPVVRDLCLQLAARGLLHRSSQGQLSLGCDPDRTRVADVIDAIIRDPALDAERAAAGAQLEQGARTALALIALARIEVGRGPTLRELAASDEG